MVKAILVVAMVAVLSGGLGKLSAFGEHCLANGKTHSPTGS